MAEERRRLGPLNKTSQLLPFMRASALTDIALYWLPVRAYPMSFEERRWALDFFRHLKNKMDTRSLRLESFLQFKALYPDLLNRFLSRSQDYSPLLGLLLQPGGSMPDPPTFEDIEAEVKKGGPVDVKQWMADYCYWFMAKQDERQREDFFGLGGMILLFLKTDPDATPPVLKIPKVMRSHPALQDVDIESKMAIAYSLQDKFLKLSKDVFGETVRDDPSYPGIPYVLPLLRSADLFAATAEQRSKWFEVFEIYSVESKADRGILLAARDNNFDDALIESIQEVRKEGIEYPTGPRAPEL